jgi:ribose/xylose/arabinose/galactoside ABC-type transport system permease subunit
MRPAPIIGLLILVAVFWSMNERFLSLPNFYNILRQSSVLLIVATGLTFVILLGSIDLSVGAVVTLSALVTAIAIRDYQVGIFGAILTAAAVGIVCGAINGALVIVARVPSFVVTLGTLTALDGVSTWVSGGRNIIFSDEWVRWMASGMLSGIPNVALWALLIFAIAAFVGLRTHVGRGIYATGAGTKAAVLAGYDVARLKFFAFVASGLMAGIAGLMMVARTSSGTPRMGEGLMLDAIAAVVIGGTALSGGAGGVYRTIIGVIIISVIKNGLNVVGVHPYLQIVISGLLVIVAVALILNRDRLMFVK